jgi:hypothetical protein
MRAEDFMAEIIDGHLTPLLEKFDRVVERRDLSFEDALRCMLLFLSQMRVSLALDTKGPMDHTLTTFQSIEMDLMADILSLDHIRETRKRLEKEDTNGG